MDPKKFLENDEGVNCCDISVIRLEDITIEPPTEFEMKVWKEHFQNQEFDGLLDMVHWEKLLKPIQESFREMLDELGEEVEGGVSE